MLKLRSEQMRAFQAVTPQLVVPCARRPPQPVKQWVEVVLVDMEGAPLPGEKYRVTLPGGQVREGTLDSQGQAGFYELEPGSCIITFPDLDRDAWEEC